MNNGDKLAFGQGIPENWRQRDEAFKAKYGTTRDRLTYTEAAIHRRLDTIEHKLDALLAALEDSE